MTQAPARQPPPGRRIAKLASGTFIGTLLGAVLTFANEVLVARLLGVEGYGLYALGIMAARVGEIVCMLGLRVSVLHFLPIYLDERRYPLVAGVIRASTVLPVVAGLLYVGAVWLAAPYLDRHVFGAIGAAPYMSMLVLAVPAMCLSEIFGNITRAYGFARYHVITRSLVPPVLYLLLIAWLSASNGDDFAVTLAFVSAHCTGLVTGALCVWWVSYADLRSVTPEPAYRRLYGYSFPVFLNTVLYVCMVWLGLWFVASFGSAAQTGIYRAAMQVTIVFETIGLAFNAATAHIFPVAIKARDVDRLQQLYSQVTRLVSILALTALVVVVVCSREILALLGDEFQAGWLALSFLALAHTILCWSSCAGFLLVIGRKQTLETRNALVAVIANFIGCWMLVPIYGVNGAALAAVAGCGLFALLRVSSASRAFALTTQRLRPLRTVGVSLLAGALSYPLADALSVVVQGALFVLVCKVAIAGTVMAGLLWALDLDASERATLRRVIPAL